jgi:hypothetical protein
MWHFWEDRIPQFAEPKYVLSEDDLSEDDDESEDGVEASDEVSQQRNEGGGDEIQAMNCADGETDGCHLRGGLTSSEVNDAASDEDSVLIGWYRSADDHYDDIICVALRPERNLTVTWIGPPWMNYALVTGIQPRLDFYVDAGKLRPNMDGTRDGILMRKMKETHGRLSLMPLVGHPK